MTVRQKTFCLKACLHSAQIENIEKRMRNFKLPSAQQRLGVSVALVLGSAIVLSMNFCTKFEQ